MVILGNHKGMEKVIKKSRGYIIKESEVPKGTVMKREELFRRIKEIIEDLNSRRYDSCRVCLARWRMS